jgi:outer membrane protein assembly factor BamB
MGRNASGGSVNGIDPLTGKVLWTYGNFQCSIPVAHAVDAGEGRVLMTGEEPPFSKGGAVLADGPLLATDGSRKLYLIDPDPAAFKPLASAEMLEAGNNWAPIALVDGKLLIRDQKQLKVLQVAQRGQ